MRRRSMSRGRALSLAKPGATSGLKDSVQANKGVRLADIAQRKRSKQARRGEGDR